MNAGGPDRTTDPALRSWVESANDPASDFPIQNLPWCVFAPRVGGEDVGDARVGIGIGDRVLDVHAALRAGLIDAPARAAAECCGEGSLNALMDAGRESASTLRRAVSALLADDSRGTATASRAADLLHPVADVRLLLPARIGDYSDFYASIDHATNVGTMMRPDNPLLPNYRYVPIGYHGRASSIVVSETDVRRPWGQLREGGGSDAPPTFAPTRRLDYEVEVGACIAGDNALGDPVSIDDAEQRLFGLCLVNDWSARDIQTWEYQPLGPFLAKSFATSVSPWVVSMDALAPFRVAARPRTEDDPPLLSYLSSARDRASGQVDLQLEVWLSSARMRERGVAPMRVSRGRFRDLYWTLAQLITHHASNGCNLRPGDLIASGTVSGADEESRGCLLERTERGAKPLALPDGETRAFLEDGDEVTIRGWCERAGWRRIGFGECRGTVLSASGVTPG